MLSLQENLELLIKDFISDNANNFTFISNLILILNVEKY